MTVLAILDHTTHRLCLECVTDKMLEPYNGDEQAYIDDMYSFEGDYSWDYVTSIVDYTDESVNADVKGLIETEIS